MSRYRLARQELAPPAVVTHPAPFFLDGADERQRRELAASASIQTAAPFCARAAGIRVLARGLLLDDAGALLVSPQFHAWAGPDHPLRREILWDWLERDQPQPPGAEARLDPDDLVVRHFPGRSVLLAQPGTLGFGHWLTEILPRIAIALELGLGGERFLLPSPLPGFGAAFLALLGIAPEQLALYDHRAEMPLCDELFVPSRLFDGRAYPPFAREVFAAVGRRARADREGPATRRIFLSRRAWRSHRAGFQRTASNRDQLVPVLTAWGFAEVLPEQLDLNEQIEQVAGATVIVAEEGSGAHLSLFARPRWPTGSSRASTPSTGFVSGGPFPRSMRPRPTATA